MAFAGATENIFQLLKEKFSNYAQKEISISFRVPQEIAAMANDFTGKFMPYRPKLTTNKVNDGKKPVIFLAGKEKDYQLTAEEENKIEEKLKSIHWEKVKEILFFKKIVHLITFPNGELANDFQNFLAKKEVEWLTVTHHDKVHSKTWKTEYSLQRIDELIRSKERNQI